MAEIWVQRLRGLAAIGLCLGWGLCVGAAEPPAAGPGYDPEAYEYEPEAFQGERISLLEAVRLTLENSPTILLEAQNARFREGLLQEQTGAFDAVLNATTSYEYRQQELTFNQRNQQVMSREDRRTRVDAARARAEATQDRLDEIIAAQEDRRGAIFSDPTLQAQVDLLNQLIDTAPNDEVRSEYERILQENLQSLRETFEDDLENARQQETAALDELRRLGRVPTVEERWEAVFDISYVKPYRSGIRFTPYFNFAATGSNFRGKPDDPEFGGQGTKDQYRAGLGFRVFVPLGRGRGFDSAAAAETAAKIDYEASLAAFQHANSVAVLNTLVAYWNLVAAQERVDVFAQSFGLQNDLVNKTNDLIEGDIVPRAELARVNARQAEIEATLNDARRALYTARIGLARTIGLTVESDEQAPLAADPFPAPGSEEWLDDVTLQRLILEAVQRRSDYQAARQLQSSGKVLLRAARLDLKPRVDFNGDFSYTGLDEQQAADEGIEGALLGKWVGPTAALSLDGEFPLKNNVQKGRLLQSVADYQQRVISASDLMRSIKAGVLRLARSVESAIDEVALNEQSVGYYQQTHRDELDKLSFGESTLINTILTEQRLTESLLAKVGAQLRYAQFLSQLRFETGVLVEHGEDGSHVSAEELRSLPFTEDGPGGA